MASIIDITERRRADEDLRESQRELRALTGRLLMAQETECRRIARELHDDLNQDLALWRCTWTSSPSGRRNPAPNSASG